MKTQVKKWGDSKILVLSPEFIKFHNIEIGDWLDIGDVVKVKPESFNQVN